VNSTGELHQLINANVQADDVGKYSCVAENEAGVATCVAKVKLFGKKCSKMSTKIYAN
jgi:Immunoglobulin I-set domain